VGKKVVATLPIAYYFRAGREYGMPLEKVKKMITLHHSPVRVHGGAKTWARRITEILRKKKMV